MEIEQILPCCDSSIAANWWPNATFHFSSDLPAGKQVSMDELQADIKQSLEKNFQEFLEAKPQAVTDDGLRMLRVVAAGESSELPPFTGSII